MMAYAQRRTYLLVGLAVAAGASLVAAATELRSAKTSAATAGQNLALCKRLAEQISQLRSRPSQITWHAASSSELGRQIEQAAVAAEIPRVSLVRIDPQPARRVAGSDYKEQLTSLELRSATMPQLVGMLQQLQEEAGLEPTALHLAAPKNTSADAETWAVQLTLTNLVFAPKNTPTTSPHQH